VSKNKVLTRDNLEKRRAVEDSSCLFCDEKESVTHLLFEYVVAKSAWEIVSVATGCNVGVDYESIAKLWLCNKRFGTVNMINAAVCWGCRN
jgi:hypothetical protein